MVQGSILVLRCIEYRIFWNFSVKINGERLKMLGVEQGVV